MKNLKYLALAAALLVTSVAMAQQAVDPDQQGNGQTNSSTLINPPVNFEQPFYTSGQPVQWQRFNFAEVLATGRYRDGRFRNLQGSLERQQKYLTMVQNGTAKKVELSFPSLINMWHGGNTFVDTLVPEGASAFVRPTPLRIERYYRPMPGDANRLYVEEWTWWSYLAHEYCGNHGSGVIVHVERIPVTKLTRTEVRVEYKDRVIYVDRPQIVQVPVPVAGQPQQGLIWTAVTSRNQIQTSGVTRWSISFGGCWTGGGSSTGGNPTKYCEGGNPIDLGTAPANLPPLTGPNRIQNARLDPALGGGGVGGGTGPGNGGTPISIPPPPTGG